MKAEELYEKEFGNADSIPKESVIRLLKNFARVLQLERDKALRQPLVTCCCMVCGKDFQGEEPKMCCSGMDCGCIGMPIEPVVCSYECYDKLMSRNSR